MNDFAPIVLFAYNRLQHTKQTIEALKKNDLANASELFIYSDAPQNERASQDVRLVREYIHVIDGFKKITVIERDQNWGLAASIIDGVTNLVNQYGKLIVLEDDLVTSPQFLTFMNDALDFYIDKPEVMHISGWNYPIDPEGLGDAFLWPVMNCWGWATWADRWRYFHKDPAKLINTWSREEIKRFNLENSYDFWAQVIKNNNKKISTWAVFWYASIFEKKGLCLNPTHSFVVNIGFDDSGENCGSYNPFPLNLSARKMWVLPSDIEVSSLATQRIKSFCKRMKGNLVIRVLRRVYKFFGLKSNILYN
jgi:GT2 family glycosyltransferase